MEIIAYVSFGEVRFGEQENAVVQRLGAPDRRVVNKNGETELHYAQIVIRTNGHNRVVEITSRPEYIFIGVDRISRHYLPEYLKQHDPETKERCGFVISRKYGAAVDTDTINDGWISVFVQDRLDDWIS